MLIFTQMTDYAMVIVHFMAENQGVSLDCASIAERTGVPQPSVSILLKKLVKSGICGSSRGAKGGYYLVKPASAISVLDVIVGIQGEVMVARCVHGDLVCSKTGQCALQPQWIYLNQLLQGFLAAISFDQMQGPLAQHPLLQSMQQLIHQHQGAYDGHS